MEVVAMDNNNYGVVVFAVIIQNHKLSWYRGRGIFVIALFHHGIYLHILI